MKRIINSLIILSGLVLSNIANAELLTPTISGSWDNFELGESIQTFKVELVEAASVCFTLEPTGNISPAYSNIKLVDQNSSEISNSCQNNESGATNLAAGTYYIQASAYLDDENSIDNLEIQFNIHLKIEINNSAAFSIIPRLKQIKGTWTSSGDRNDLADVGNLFYKLELMTAENITLVLESNDENNSPNPYLILVNLKNNEFFVLAENDDASESTENSQITSGNLEPGDYYVVASTNSEGEKGDFVLSLYSDEVEKNNIDIKVDDENYSGDLFVAITMNPPNYFPDDLINDLKIYTTVTLTISVDNFESDNPEYCEEQVLGFELFSTTEAENPVFEGSATVYNGCKYKAVLVTSEHGVENSPSPSGTFEVSVRADGTVKITNEDGDVIRKEDNQIQIGGFSLDKGLIEFNVKQKNGDSLSNISTDETDKIYMSLTGIINSKESTFNVNAVEFQNEIYIRDGIPLVTGEYNYELIYAKSENIIFKSAGSFNLFTESETYPITRGTLEINVNNPPLALNLNPITVEDNSINVVLQATDAEHDSLTYEIVDQSNIKNGVLNQDQIQSGKVLYTPNANFSCMGASCDSFTYKASDDTSDSNVATVTITVSAVNDPPVAAPLNVSVVEDTPKVITLSASDIDSNGLTFSTVANPTKGVLSDLSNNKVTYTPNLNFSGIDSFTYKANDGVTDSQIVTVTIDVSAVNDAPVFTSSPLLTGQETKTYNYTPTASDADGDTLSFTVTTKPNWINFVNGVLSGVPALGEAGDHLVTIEVSDNAQPAKTMIQSFTIVISEYVYSPFELNAPADIIIEATGVLTDIELGHPEVVTDSPETITTLVDNTGPFAVGEHLVIWTATDSGNNTVTATQKVTIKDTTAPLIVVPDLIEINATGEFTDISSKLNLTASDLVDGDVEVEIISNNLQKSGMQQILVKTTDSHNNQAEQIVNVAIHPQIMLGLDKMAEKSSNVLIPLQLNGAAAIFPVTINYQIENGAQQTNGEFIFESDADAHLSIALPNDLMVGEQIRFKLITAQNAVLTNDKTLLVTITDTNIAPTLKVELYQANKTVLVVDQTAGQIELKADVYDINISDTHSLVWLDSDSNVLGHDASLVLNPASLSIGKNTILVTVNETNTSEANSTSMETVFWITESLPILTSMDTDGDGVSDIDEGYEDQDGDGIPNFKDNNNASNELPASNGIRKLLAPTGIQLSLGSSVQQMSEGLGSSASITQTELESLFGDLAIDDEYSIALPIIDFVASGLNQQGDSVTVVIALSDGQSIPANANYRKFSTNSGWREFVSGATDRIASSLTDAEGNCPSWDSASYEEGLKAGDECFALTIKDGGSNDSDALANAIVTDPGAIVVALPNLPAQIVVSGNMSVNEGGVLILDASGSSDPEGKPLSYLWQQLSGPQATLIDFNSAILKLTSPDVSNDEQIELQLTVNDGKNNSIWTKVIHVVFVNQPPELSLSASSSSVNENESVTLTATASDPDGQTLSYLWEQVSGPNVSLGSSNTATLTIKMPNVEVNSKLVFKVSVSDGSDTVSQYMNVIVVDKEGGTISLVNLFWLWLFYGFVRFKSFKNR
jgi:hypothetical protein